MDINHVKYNINTYLPGLIKLIGNDNDFGWQKIDSQFTALIDKRIEDSKGESMTIPSTIFDIIIAARKQNPSAILLLNYFNNLFYDLGNRLSEDEKQLVRPTIKNMLKSKDNRYFEFLSELAVLNNLTKTEKYILEKVETRLENGKSIDFLLKEKTSNNLKLIEVYNIHLAPDKVSNENQMIEKFIHHRINNKIADKTKGIVGKDFFVIPVLHGPIQSLMTFSGFFLKNKLKIKGVAEPLAYLTISNVDGSYYHRFGRISAMFYSDEESEDLSEETYIAGI